MLNVYNINGLVFWSEKDIVIRNMIVQYIVKCIKDCLKQQNKAWDFHLVEATTLMPLNNINSQYNDDVYKLDQLALRPETTNGSYEYAKYVLEHTENKINLPLCVYQHGKSYRIEQDQPIKNMRLKEFYQLEFQCIYGETTKNDYSKELIPCVSRALSKFVGDVRTEPSDRLPNYAEWTQDIICEKSDMEICSISQRKDFPNAKVIEVAIGTDRCVYNFNM